MKDIIVTEEFRMLRVLHGVELAVKFMITE